MGVTASHNWRTDLANITRFGRQFQRLRRCKQLGHASLRFPGAQHTRFEHSLGVAYKAGIVVNRIQENQPLLNVDDKDKLCVEIAALVHDIGHG